MQGVCSHMEQRNMAAAWRSLPQDPQWDLRTPEQSLRQPASPKTGFEQVCVPREFTDS